MKKIFTFLSVSLITLLLVSCGGGQDYRNMVPADAVAVISFKPKTIAHKAQIGDFTQSDLYKLLEAKLIKDEELSSEAREYILSLIAEPSRTGLSMDHDAFLFVTGKQLIYGRPEVVGLFKVKERKAVDSFTDFIVEQSNMEKIEEDGITFLKYDRSFTSELIAYNDDAFMVLSSPDKYEKSMPVIKQRFAQKKEESIMNRPQIASVLEGNNDMNLVVSYSTMMPIFQQFGMDQAFGWMGKMRVVATGNFEKGEMVSDMKALFDSEEAEQQYMEIMGNFPKATGELAKYLPEGSIATVGGGINGTKLYEMMTKIPLYGVAMSMYPQVQTIMDALEGDMLISFNTLSHDGKYPLGTLVANVNDVNISATIRDLAATAGMKFVETATGHFVGNLNGVQVWMGCKDDIFYITTDNGVIQLLANGEGESMNDRFGHVFADSYSSAVIDFVTLNTLIRMYLADNHGFFPLKILFPFFEVTDNIQMSAHTPTEFKTVSVMVDKDKNSAEVMFNAFEAVIKMGASFASNHDACCHHR